MEGKGKNEIRNGSSVLLFSFFPSPCTPDTQQEKKLPLG